MSDTSPVFDDTGSEGAGRGSRRPKKPGPWVNVTSTRLQRARYDGTADQIHVIFRDGTPWTYDGVPRNIWNNFRRSASKGRYIDRVLNNFNYWEGGFDYSSGEDTEERYQP